MQTLSAPRAVGRADGRWRGNLVRVAERRIVEAELVWAGGIIRSIRELGGERVGLGYLIPGFIDAHIHIESSLLVPTEFARVAVRHGTVACVCDPHEIANVLGMIGLRFMLDSAARTPFCFVFGAPPCVPATVFETAGAALSGDEIACLLREPGIGFLAEVMDVPGVLSGNPSLRGKLAAARRCGKPIDGHAPGLRGKELARYAAAGISTDHECATLDEAMERLACGMHVLIREGSAARNFEALHVLIGIRPDRVMFCSDDRHPDDLVAGHIDRLAARAVGMGHDVFEVLRCACCNPADHYRIPVGRLRVGDRMDAVEVEDVRNFVVRRTWLQGTTAYEDGATRLPSVPIGPVNRFAPRAIRPFELAVPAEGREIRVIEVCDGELATSESLRSVKAEGDRVAPDPQRDLLLLAVINRYEAAPPAVAFAHGFGLRRGAIASSIAHDSHNVIAVGADADSVCAAVNSVMRERGGLAVFGPEGLKLLSLPVAGLMSTEDGDSVAREYAELNRYARRLGSGFHAPLMTLSFLSLLVIPALKLSDRGLFDGRVFRFVSLFTEKGQDP